jgi:ATP-dependent RNA helicase DeaD
VAPPRRHSKPHVSADGEGPLRKLIVAGGRAAGLEPSDIIHAITAASGLDGEAIRNVRVLERFAFVEVPEQEAERVVERVGASEGLRIEPARG